MLQQDPRGHFRASADHLTIVWAAPCLVVFLAASNLHSALRCQIRNIYRNLHKFT